MHITPGQQAEPRLAGQTRCTGECKSQRAGSLSPVFSGQHVAYKEAVVVVVAVIILPKKNKTLKSKSFSQRAGPQR